MSCFRVGARRNGKNAVFEVNHISSFALARDFVIRETQADVVLALVNPIEPKEIPAPTPEHQPEAA